MDEALARAFVEEARMQCRYADLAFRQIHGQYAQLVRLNRERAEAAREAEGLAWNSPLAQDTYRTEHLLWLAVHSFLAHAANVSKLLWPGQPRRPLSPQDVKARGEQLRAELGLAANMLLANRTMRDHLEHGDERIQAEYAATRSVPARVIRIAPAQGVTQVEFAGATYDLGLMLQDVRLVLEASEAWLTTGGYLSPVR